MVALRKVSTPNVTTGMNLVMQWLRWCWFGTLSKIDSSIHHNLSFHSIQFHFISFHLISFNLIPSHFIQFHFISFNSIPSNSLGINEHNATQQRACLVIVGWLGRSFLAYTLNGSENSLKIDSFHFILYYISIHSCKCFGIEYWVTYNHPTNTMSCCWVRWLTFRLVA